MIEKPDKQAANSDTLYAESVQEAAQIARVALPLASKYNLPAHPINYMVLYEYVAGSNAQLKHAADEVLNTADRLTQEQIYGLYNQYIQTGDEAHLREIRELVKRILSDALGSLTSIGENAANYQQSLQTNIDQLRDDMGIDEIRVVISKVVNETRETVSSGLALQQQLEQANKELEELRLDFERVQDEALVDPLTGINNRRAFDKALEGLANAAPEAADTPCLLIVDVDHFKKFNDTHGHIVGDEVLRFVARRISDNVRGSDVVARYGGEEFAVLLPETPLAGAMKVADNIRVKLRDSPLRRKSTNQNVGNVTVSVGVARYVVGEPLESFVARADRGLYYAKKTGRDRVCCDEDIDSRLLDS